MQTITKRQLAARIRTPAGSEAAALIMVQLLFDAIIDELSKGNRIECRDFGVLEPRPQKARMGHNPKTLEPVAIPARVTISFKPGRQMKQAVRSALLKPSPER